MKFKIVALDLDDTLLTTNKTIKLETVDYLKRLMAKGVVIAITTGRSLVGIAKITDKYLLNDCYFIAYNGGKIVHEDEVIYEKKLSQKDMEAIIKYARKLNIHFVVWINEVAYVENKDRYIIDNYQYDLIVVDDILTLGLQANKIIWVADSKQIEDCKTYLNSQTMNCNYCTSKPIYLEFSPLDISKGEGLFRLANLLGVDQKEIIAIGDGENDIPMIKYAGVGIAMGNANDDVKIVADMVTESNDNEGVKKALQKLFI